MQSLADRGFKENQVLIQNCPFSVKRVRWFIIQKGIVIESCSHDTWMGRTLTPQLHHKNGDRLDNRKENLIWLCPNCHSLTENYAFNGRKHKRESLIKGVETKRKNSEETVCKSARL